MMDSRPAPAPSKPDVRRHRRRLAARERAEGMRLSSERLESRIALTISIGGFPTLIDRFGNGTPGPVAGNVVIASDRGDDIYIRQVASATQDLQVSTTSSFNSFQVVDNIDGLYERIFVTNGTRRSDSAVLPVMPLSTVTSFRATTHGIDSIVGGTIEYRQSDGSLSTWTVTPVAGVAMVITAGPGVTTALPSGSIQPTAIRLAENPAANRVPTDYFQSRFDVEWSAEPNRLNFQRLNINYLTFDSIPIPPPFVFFPPRPVNDSLLPQPNAGAGSSVTFVLPGAQAAIQDGGLQRQSLGIIPGTFSGTISGSWSGFAYTVSARAATDGTLLFGGRGGWNRSIDIVSNTEIGLIAITGSITTDGTVELSFRRWNGVANADDLFPAGTFGFVVNRGTAAVAGPVQIASASYLTYTREAVANSATFWAGQTITRDVTVDLLTPGSTLNVDSPIIVRDATTVPGDFFDVDFRATNINVRAAVSAPDRLSVGRSQLGRERMSIAPDYNNPYLSSPSMPSLHALPPARQALVAAEVVDGRVVRLDLLPGFQGSGYDPLNPPDVQIAAPAATAGSRQARARAIVGPDGRITGFAIVDGGAGYMPFVAAGLPAPARVTVSIDPPPDLQRPASARVAEINAATGGVVRIEVLDPGYRYHAPPRVSVAPPAQFDIGVQATARAVLNPDGSINRIEVLDPGSGYRERPVVTIADPAPTAKAERIVIDAELRADIYELYVGDDFGTDLPRGSLRLGGNGSVSTPPVPARAFFLPSTPESQQVILLPVSEDGAFPPGFNPAGNEITGFGIPDRTRILTWDPDSFTATVAVGTISNSSLNSLPLNHRVGIAVRANSLYLEASTADLFLEGAINVAKQSYLIESPAAAASLAPFAFTTRSSSSGAESGLIEGNVVDITLANAAGTPLSGSTLFSDVRLETFVDRLRVRAASSADDPQGPFPYRLTISDGGDLAIDGLAASGLPLAVAAKGSIDLASVIETYGDVSLDAGTALQLRAPVQTRFGRIEVSGESVDIRSPLVVEAAAVLPGRQDVVVEARGGDIFLQGGIFAVNSVILDQSNLSLDRTEVLVTSFTVIPGLSTETISLFDRRFNPLPANFNPVGRLVSAPGIRPGTRIVAWDNLTGQAEIPAGSILNPDGSDLANPNPFFGLLLPAAGQLAAEIVPGRIEASNAKVVADDVVIRAEGKSVSLRSNVNRLTASVAGDFTLSEIDDIDIPLLVARGIVSLAAGGADQGPTGQNPVALTATLVDATALVVSTPNGSARIQSNNSGTLLVGDAARLYALGDRAAPMEAAGNVTIRSRGGDLVLLDAPIAGGSARPVRVATSAPLPVTATYLPGVAGATPSSLSGAGSLNALGANYWGLDERGQPIVLAVGDLVLVKDQPQTRPSGDAALDHTRENGVYRVASVGGGAFGSQRWQLVRDAASDTAEEMPNGTLVRVQQGEHANQVFRIGYDAILPTRVERVGTNQLQFPELFPSFGLLEVGMIVNGAGIAPNSVITAIDPVARVVTLDVVNPGQVFRQSFMTDSGLVTRVPVGSTSGDAITLAAPAGFNYADLAVGQQVIGAGIRPGTVITRVDSAANRIDVATALLETPYVTAVNGTTVQFGDLFTQFPQLRPGQQIQFFNAEAEPLGGPRTIGTRNDADRTVTFNGPDVSFPASARIWTPGSLPQPFSTAVASVGLGAVVVAPDNPLLSDVRIGQRIELVSADGLTTVTRLVSDLIVRTDAAGAVQGNVTIGFNELLTGGERTALSGGTISFLAPAELEFGVSAPRSVPVVWNAWDTADNRLDSELLQATASTPVEFLPGQPVSATLTTILPETLVVPTAVIANGAGTTQLDLAGAALFFNAAVIGQPVQFLTAANALVNPQTAPLFGGVGSTVATLDTTIVANVAWLASAIPGQSLQFLSGTGAVLGTATINAVTAGTGTLELSAVIPAGTASIRRLHVPTITAIDPNGTITLSEPAPAGAGQVRLLPNGAPLLRNGPGNVASITPLSPLFLLVEPGHTVEFFNAAGTAVLGTATVTGFSPVTGLIDLTGPIPAATGLIRIANIVSLDPVSAFMRVAQVGDQVQFIDALGTVLPGVGQITRLDTRTRGLLVLDVPRPAAASGLRLPNVAQVAPGSQFFSYAQIGDTVGFRDTSGAPVGGGTITFLQPDQQAVRFSVPVPTAAATVIVNVPADVAVLPPGASFFDLAESAQAAGVVGGVGTTTARIASLSTWFDTASVGQTIQFLDASDVQLGTGTITGLRRAAGDVDVSVSVPAGTARIRRLDRVEFLLDRSNIVVGDGLILETDPATGRVTLVNPPALDLRTADLLGGTDTIIGQIAANDPWFATAVRLQTVQFLDAAGVVLGSASIIDVDPAAGTVRVTAAIPQGTTQIRQGVVIRLADKGVVRLAATPALGRALPGDRVAFLDQFGEVIPGPEVRITALGASRADGTRDVQLDGPVPVDADGLQPQSVRVLSRVLTLPAFTNFQQLSIGLEVFVRSQFPGEPAVVERFSLAAFDPIARTITLSGGPSGLVSSVEFGIGAITGRYPGNDTLVLDGEFQNFSRLFVGQRVYGAGIEAGAVIVGIDPVARSIALTPGSVAGRRGPFQITRAHSLSNPFYTEQFDDWFELDQEFNDYGEIKVGQRVALRDAAGVLLKVAVVTGVDPAFRTIGLENGSLNGIVGTVSSAEFLPVSNVRFGVVDGEGSGLVEVLLKPLGLSPISVGSQEVRTNVGTDSVFGTATFVVSTLGRTNDAPGSLGKMIDAFQRNDSRKSQVDVAVVRVVPGADGTWVLHLAPTFSDYDRLYSAPTQNPELAGEPVVGTPRMFTSGARVRAVDATARTVTLEPGSLSSLAVENLTRVTSVTLPIATPNPEQQLDFKFWTGLPAGDIQLFQELPAIRRAMTIDAGPAGRTNLGLPAGSPARIAPRLVIDGQRINRSRSGNAVAGAQVINGFEIIGSQADGTVLASMNIGGFLRGSAVRIDGAKNVVVRDMGVGLGSGGARLPNLRGITVTGDAARDNTILGGSVVSATAAGIAIEGSARSTTVVGTKVGLGGVDNVTGILIDDGARGTRIGVDEIAISAPLTASAVLTAGSPDVQLNTSLFSRPLIGLDVSGLGVPAGTKVLGVDSARSFITLSNPVTRTGSASLTLGHFVTRGVDDDPTLLQVPPSISLDQLFVGQGVSGGGIAPGTVITAIDRDQRRVRISTPVTIGGAGVVTFERPSRTIVQNNQTGITVRGPDTVITNTDVLNNARDGVVVAPNISGTRVGTAALFGVIGTANEPNSVPLASWPTITDVQAGSSFVTLPASFSGGQDVRPGTPVFGPGIRAGTVVSSVVPPGGATTNWRVNLSLPVETTGRAVTVSFGILDAAGQAQRLSLENAADRGRLFVGQELLAAGLPEFTRIAGVRMVGANDYVSVTAPLAGLPVTNFSALAAGPATIVQRTTSANRFSGNGRFGILLQRPEELSTRVAGNYFGMLNETTSAAAGNAAGAVDSATPARYQPSSLHNVDSQGNRHGLSSGPGAPPTSGGGNDPLPPTRPGI